MSYTNRARLMFVVAPVFVPFSLFMSFLCAIIDATERFGDTLSWGLRDNWRFWYRDVYRVARYGSVHDRPVGEAKP